MSREDIVKVTLLAFRKACEDYYESKGISTSSGEEGFFHLEKVENYFEDLLQAPLDKIDKLVSDT